MKVVTPKLRYVNNVLYFENVNLKNIAEKIPTPVYVYSKSQIVENFLKYKNAFGNRDNIICFAIKSNSNHEVLKIIKDLKGGADVTSGGEIFRAIKAGIEPNKIVYAGVGKTVQEIMYAAKIGVLMYNVESKDEVDILNQIAKKLKKKLNIAIRVNPEVTTHTIKHISTGEEGTKFGIPIGDVLEFAKYIKETCKDLNLVGLHFHIGSQICVLKPFLEATKKVVKLLKPLEKLGFRIKYFDIGGGLGVKYKEETPPTPQQLIGKILNLLPKELTIICEPGRSIVGNAGILICKVLYHKKVKNKNYLIVDASMTDLIRPAFYGAYHNIVPLELNSNNSNKNYYDIVGPVCETSDFLGKNRLLPDVANGKYLVVETAGAYGFVMSSNYNSRLKPAEVVVNKDEFYLVREKDKLIDLIRKEVIKRKD